MSRANNYNRSVLKEVNRQNLRKKKFQESMSSTWDHQAFINELGIKIGADGPTKDPKTLVLGEILSMISNWGAGTSNKFGYSVNSKYVDVKGMNSAGFYDRKLGPHSFSVPLDTYDNLAKSFQYIDFGAMAKDMYPYAEQIVKVKYNTPEYMDLQDKLTFIATGGGN